MARAAAPRILFLDEDHVLRMLRMLLRNEEAQASFRDWFAPEPVDLGPVIGALQGLRHSDGALAGLASEEPSLQSDADAIVFRRGLVDAELLSHHPRLRIVVRLGERPEGIDVEAVRRAGAQVFCMPRDTIHVTAEHVLLLMLACGKQLTQGQQAVRAGALDAKGSPAAAGAVAYNWAGLRGVGGLYGSTLGIIGLGEVGSRVARLAGAFGMKVLYHKPRRAAPAVEQSLGVDYADLAALLAASDFVSLNAPNVPATQRMANGDFFRTMKRGAHFINTSRGSLVDEDALYEALTSGHLGGAGLDVHAAEPRAPGDRIAALPNVVLTPHVGGGARSGVLREFMEMGRQLRRALDLAAAPDAAT